MSHNRNLNDSYRFGRDCSICLEKLNKNKVYLNCNHYFHKDCINNWKTRNNTCPICRTRIIQIKEALTIRKIIRLILVLIIFIIITKLVINIVFQIIEIIIAIILNIVKIPSKFILNFLKILANIIYLIIIIAVKFIKNIILKLFSTVINSLCSLGIIFDRIINYMNKLKINLENINRDL